MSVGFTILFIALNSSMNVQSLIMETDGYGALGFYNNAVFALFVGFGCLISTHVMKKIGDKWCMCISAATISMWITCSVLGADAYERPNPESIFQSTIFVYCVTLFLAAVSGTCFSLLWVSEGQYVSSCANINNKGLYCSIFWAFYMLS